MFSDSICLGLVEISDKSSDKDKFYVDWKNAIKMQGNISPF